MAGVDFRLGVRNGGETVATGRVSQDAEDNFQLECTVGGLELRLPIRPGETLIGSSPENSLVLSESGVSRTHSRLDFKDGRLSITDCDSKNGVYVNGVKVLDSELSLGDQVHLGPVLLTVTTIRDGDSRLAIALPEVDTPGLQVDQPTETRNTRSQREDELVAALRFPDSFVVGRSTAIDEIYRQLGQLTRGRLPVLITGPTGAGKELIARTLHLSSDRTDRPFVAVNCAAIPAELLEAELFGIGHKVATSVNARQGRIEAANGGVMLLDEIGDMPLALQAKLLRVLQDGEIQPVGSTVARHVDVRFVSSSNADLSHLMQVGKFREDLYYRLAGFTLRLPALRDRREDIPSFVESFMVASAREIDKPIRGISVAALDMLMAAHWPGNTRQLEHCVKQLVYFCPRYNAIDSRLVDKVFASTGPSSDVLVKPEDLDLKLNTEALERRLIQTALQQSEGNRTQAAKLLGITRNGLAMKIKRLALNT